VQNLKDLVNFGFGESACIRVSYLNPAYHYLIHTKDKKEEMPKISLTDESGRWFEVYETRAFQEAEERVYRQELFRTPGGAWILSYWSVYGDTRLWAKIQPEEAARWLLINGHNPEEYLSEFAHLEIE
jgi:hypothetical protein